MTGEYREVRILSGVLTGAATLKMTGEYRPMGLEWWRFTGA